MHKRRPGGDNWRNASDRDYQLRAPSQAKMDHTDFPAPPTIPDATNAARNRSARTQLQLFKLIGDYYEREYGEALIHELRTGKDTPPVITFEALFTKANLKLEDVKCECAATPDAKNLVQLKAALPTAKNIKKDTKFTVRLTIEQYAQLNEAYKDKAISDPGRGGIG